MTDTKVKISTTAHHLYIEASVSCHLASEMGNLNKDQPPFLTERKAYDLKFNYIYELFF